MQLKHFVEKLKQHSKKLDNYAILNDQPWITRTENENERCVFIFRQKENELLISINGKVEKGKWDYIPSMKSLLLETGKTTTLYNQGFLDDSVMILKVDGTDEYQLFVNENRITSTVEKLLKEVENRYLQENLNNKNLDTYAVNKTSQHKKVVQKKLSDGRIFLIHSSLTVGYTVGDKVTINGEPALDGKYRFGWADSIVVEDGKIKKL